MSETTRKADPVTLGAIAVFVTFAYLHFRFGYYFAAQNGFSVGNDDAFISFRYARNLVEHGILSFNPTDAPPVEGFSNPALVALAALLYPLAGPDRLYPVMATLGVIAMAAGAVLAARHIAEEHGRAAGHAAIVILASCPALFIHASSGMETAFVFLLQVGLWIQATRTWRRAPGALAWLCAIAGLLALFRTDGFVMPFVVAVWFILNRRLQAAIATIGSTAAVFFALLAARYAYYGLPMPLTYYAKIDGPLLPRIATAMRYLGGVAFKSGWAVTLGPASAGALVWFWRAKNNLRRLAAPPLEITLLAGLAAYYLAIGGDIYRERFLLILPPLALFASFSFFPGLARPKSALSFALVAAMVQLSTAFTMDRRLEYDFAARKSDLFITFGQFLAERRPGALLATSAAGKIPYFSELETIDMLGLNDRHIAMRQSKGATPGHSKYDADYVLSRQPAVICSYVLSDGSLTFGMDRERYLKRGYRLTYLARLHSPDYDAIRTISDDGEDVEFGTWNYGCITRLD